MPMLDPSDFGDYVTPNDVEEGDILKIINEGEQRDTQYGSRFFLGVKLLNGKNKLWRLNNTTVRRFIENFGADTKKWVGRKVTVQKTQQSVRGEMKPVLYGLPVESINESHEPNLTRCPICNELVDLEKFVDHIAKVHKEKGI